MDDVKVLLVDDKTDLLEQAGFYLEKEKDCITTETSNSPEKALEMFEENDFDAIVSDYQMPEMDGLEFLETLRNNGEDIPFIIFTGKSREEVAMKALNLGADRYLQKGRDPRSQYGVLADAVVQEIRHWRSEELLYESEKEKDLVLKNTSELVVHQDIDHNIIWANKAAAESVNVDSQEMEGQKCYEVWQNRNKPCEGCPLEKALEEGESQEGEMVSSDGRVWLVRGSLVSDENGEVEGFIETALDITERKKAQEMADQTIESMEDGILVCDLDGVINMINPALEEITGYGEEEVIGRDITDLASEIVSSDDLEKSMERLELVLSGESYSPITITLNSKEGRDIPVSIKGSIIRDEEGNPLKVVLSARDIRERKWAEEELKKSETKYRTIFESAYDAIFIMDEEKFVDCNEKTLEMFKCEREDIIGAPPWKFSPPKQPDGRDSKEKAKEKINAAFAGEPQQFDWIHTRADGEEFNAEVSLNRYELEDEDYVLAIVRDVTERREKEEKLREREDLLEAVFNASDEIIFTKDKEGRYQLANEVFAEKFDKSLDDIIGKTDFHIFSEEEAEEIREIDKKVMESGEPVRSTDILTIQGETKIFDSSKVPLRNENGEIVGVCGFAKDVSESRRAREIARETLDSMEDAILIHDMDGKIISINPAFEEITGYKESEVIGNNVRELARELVKPDDWERAMDGLETVLNGEGYSPIIVNLLSKDGRKVPVSLKGSVIKSEDEDPIRVIASARDVSKLRELRSELRKEKELIESAMDSLEDAFTVLDFEGGLVRWNDKVNELTGYSDEELSSMNILDLFREEDREQLLEGMERMVKGEISKNEATLVSKEGEHIPVEFSGSLLTDRDGKPTGFVGIGRDITERKRREEKLQRSEEKYRSLAENVSDILVRINPDGDFLYVSRNVEDEIGYSKDEIIGSNIKEFLTPESYEEAKNRINKWKSGAETLPSYKIKFEAKDGRLVPFELNTSPVREDGELKSIQITARNITEREKALEKFKSLFEASPDPTFLLNEEGVFEAVNEPVPKVLGYEKEEIIGSRIEEFSFFDDESIEKMRKNLEERFNGIEHSPYVVTGTTADGFKFYLEINARTLKKGGEPKKVVVVARNVTEREKAKEELKESEEKYRTLAEQSHDGIYIYRGNKLKFVNDRISEITGYDKDELYEMNVWDLVHPEDREKVKRIGKKRFSDEEEKPPNTYEARIITKDGETRHLEFAVTLIDYRGETAGLGAVRNITKRKEAEEKLRESEEKYRALVEQSHDGIYIYKDGKLEFVNDRICENTGYDKEELYQMNVWELIHPEDREKVKEIAERRQKGEEAPNRYEARVVTKDGETRHFEFAATLISYGGEQAGLGIIRDITERKEAEEELAERKSVLRGVLEGSRDSIYMVDEDCKYLIVNNELLSRLGKERDEVIGSKFHDFHSEEESKNFEENVKKVFKTGELVKQEHKKEDSDEFFLRTFSPIKDPETNEVVNVSITSTDITKRKEMERRLREAKDKYEELFKGANELVLTTDTDGYIKRVNRNMVKTSGYSEEELVGESVLELAPPDYEEEFTEFWQTVLEGREETRTLRSETKEGDTLWLKVGGRPIIEDGEIVELQYNAQDITERKRAEDALRESEERFRSVVESSHEGIMIVGDDYRFTYVNDELCNMLGYSRDELIGRDFRDFLDKESRELVSDYYERRQAGEEVPSRYEFNVVRKDGEKRRVEISSTIGEDSKGRTRTIAQVLDITERKKAREREEFLHSLLRHDLANKIQIIRNSLALLEDSDLSEDQEDFVEMCKKSSRHGFNLIEKVRTLKEIREEEEIEEMSLDSVMEVVISEKEPKASNENIKIDFERTECKILAGPLLEEVFSNLVENSIQHSDCEVIKIRGSVQDSEVTVTVEDDGQGISDEDKEEIFERGYRGSSAAGSGLGLYLVKRIVENYGGNVEVEDSELGGARFDVCLNLA